jgi:hypothetical protein
MAYSVAVLIGIFVWESTIGCLLRPVFSKLWIIMEKIWGLLLFPFKKTSKIYSFGALLFQKGVV